MAFTLPERSAVCGHGFPIAHPCKFCREAEPPPPPGRASASLPAAPSGWTCPSCGHSYAPWVPECHHCPVPPSFIAKGDDPGPIEVGPA